MKTPVRALLREDSPLQDRVCDGIQALQKDHRSYLDAAIRRAFADSLELDEALREGHDNEHRWDYLLGHQESGQVIGLEPHSAKSDEVSTVIAKRAYALAQLRDHVRGGSRIAAWCWVASGNVDFYPLDKAVLRLAQNGITFVGKKLLKKNLDALTPPTTRPATRRSAGRTRK